MRRAFVGFSTPIGYDYRNVAHAAPNDRKSSPNPVLYGTMGLFTLYDEIWFACESLCPQSMRALPYVKFLDREAPGLNLTEEQFDSSVKEATELFESPDGLGDEFWDIWKQTVADYAPPHVDNHSHGISFYDAGMVGNAAARQLAADVWIVSHFRKLDLELVLNPLTARRAFDRGALSLELRQPYAELQLAERVVSIDTLYDLVGVQGPYHPCIEEIREDAHIGEFRKWLEEKTTRLDNLEIRTVESEVNSRVAELRIRSIDKYVEADKLRNIPIDLVKDKITGLDPLITPIKRVFDYFNRNAQLRKLAWQAFIAKTRSRTESLRS